MNKILLFLSLFFIMQTPQLVLASSISEITGSVTNLKVQHWNESVACMQVNDKIFKLDLLTGSGKATYALAMSAAMAGKQVTVLYYDGRNPIGGCDTGPTMQPLYSVSVNP